NASRACRSRSCCEPVTGHPREAGRTRARLRCGSEVDRDRLLLAGRLGTAALGRRGGLLGPHADAELELDLLLDLDREVGVVLEEQACVLLALAELDALVGVPGTLLADDSVLDAQSYATGIEGTHALDYNS